MAWKLARRRPKYQEPTPPVTLRSCWMGSIIDKQRGAVKDGVIRIGKARAIFHMPKNIWKSRELTAKMKLLIFNSKVKSLLLYGCETWRAIKMNQEKIQIFVKRCLRSVFKIKWLDKISKELWQRADQERNTSRRNNSSITWQVLMWNLQCMWRMFSKWRDTVPLQANSSCWCPFKTLVEQINI